MVKKIILPPPEGPVPRTASTWLSFDCGEVPVEIGNLEREVFKSLSDWEYTIGPSGYGFAYREGIKEVIYNSERVDFHLYFTVPLKRHDLPIDSEQIDRERKVLEHVLDLTIIRAHERDGRTRFYAVTEPMEWMLNDLRPTLGFRQPVDDKR
jgi:hypothetical protein